MRLCLARPHLLRQQLGIHFRASVFGPLRIMFPMITDIAEWRQAQCMVEEVRAGLGARLCPWAS
ncbi:MAG: hypothetical protein KIS63_07195 [Caldilineales bacterium]|nr:hypothetical protein [Caldilineales bacterium]